MLKSCIYTGTLRHRRFAPVENAFAYSLFMMYLDLEELPNLFKGRWLWSARRPAPAWFRRADHWGPRDQPLDRAIRDLVEAESGERPRGPIRLLTHLRYFGYCQNPASFYYCFDAEDREVTSVVAEVTNTPWGETHPYVLPRSAATEKSESLRFRFPKRFHVSPFMGMGVDYDWRFERPTDRLFIHMENFENGERFFDATLSLKRREITGRSLAQTLTSHPFITFKVVATIYYQALRLWLKRAPFHPHPKHRLARKEGP